MPRLLVGREVRRAAGPLKAQTKERKKRNTPLLSRLAALVCAAAFMLITIPGQAQPQSLLTRHVREEIVSGRAQFVGQLPATQTLRFDIVMPLRDRAGLQSFVQEVQDRA